MCAVRSWCVWQWCWEYLRQIDEWQCGIDAVVGWRGVIDAGSWIVRKVWKCRLRDAVIAVCSVIGSGGDC